MFKKILCLVMALMMIASVAVIGVSAADETVAATGADGKLYFEIPSNWKNFKKVYCHIWPYGQDPLANWQSKKEACTDEGNGKWAYDPAKKVGGLTAGTTYCVIFSNDAGMQTYDALMSTACYGDTLYCDGTIYENPADSSKTAQAAFWKGQSKSVYGPLMQITSIGNIVGTCLAPGATAASMFETFLTDTLGNARTYSGKTDQQIIDDICKTLGLGQDSAEAIINKTGVKVDWKKTASSAPKQDTGVATKKPAASLGGSSSSSSKNPANGSSVTTGQEMTVVYIAIAMMLASAAVVFFARRKRIAE